MNSQIGQVIRDVADLHGVTVREIKGGSRRRDIVIARHAAIWVLLNLHPTMTCKQVAAAVGLADHTSAIYAVRKIERRIATEPAYGRELRDLLDDHRAAADPRPLDCWGWAIASRYGVQHAMSA